MDIKLTAPQNFDQLKQTIKNRSGLKFDRQSRGIWVKIGGNKLSSGRYQKVVKNLDLPSDEVLIAINGFVDDGIVTVLCLDPGYELQLTIKEAETIENFVLKHIRRFL